MFVQVAFLYVHREVHGPTVLLYIYTHIAKLCMKHGRTKMQDAQVKESAYTKCNQREKVAINFEKDGCHETK
jgi:hypothetical protein